MMQEKDVLDVLQRVIDREPPSSQDTNLDSVGKSGDDTHSLKDTDLVGKSGDDSLRAEKEQQGGDPLLEHLVEMFPSHRRSSLATKLAQCNNLQDAVEAVLREELEPEHREIPQQQPQPNADRDLKEQEEKRKRQLAKQNRKRGGATWGGGYQGAIRNRNGYTKWQCLRCGLAGPHRCFERAVTAFDEEGDWENSIFLNEEFEEAGRKNKHKRRRRHHAVDDSDEDVDEPEDDEDEEEWEQRPRGYQKQEKKNALCYENLRRKKRKKDINMY